MLVNVWVCPRTAPRTRVLTLHLVTAACYGWLHLLTVPRTLTGATRRLSQEHVSPKQAE